MMWTITSPRSWRIQLSSSLAAGLLRIPVVSHESDATAGLANRIGSLVSTRLGVAFPLDAYPQSIKQRSFYCGIPLREEFKKIWREGSQPENFILATGGSLGGRNLNSLIFKIAPQVLTKSTIVHLTGEFDLERAKEFKTPYGIFSYEHIPSEIFYTGVNRIESKNGVFFIASPFKSFQK